MAESLRLIVAGGGTGGHVLAGIAIAEAWVKNPDGASAIQSSVEFIGAQGGIEERLVPQAGYRLHLLRLGSLNGVSASRKLKTLLQLPLACFQAGVILLRRRSGCVIGVGGYSSGPVILMARVLKTLRLYQGTIAILEQNSIPGLTNRLLGRFADIIFLAFPGTEKHFPQGEVVLTGNPVRSSMRNLPSASRDPFTIFVFGGSQGAFGMNTLVIESLPYFADLAHRMKWIHQTGHNDYERVKKAYESAHIVARVEKFIDQMPEAYGVASLLICRAGSSTLSEIAAVGRAAIFVPLPTAADGHQEMNARVFADAGAGFLVTQGSTAGKDLAAKVIGLIQGVDEIDRVEKVVQRFAMPGAAENLVKALKNFGKRARALTEAGASSDKI
jgi:UDP-N-acetylglucosamine--N-acetylmuramyl-(pentapeptide) pyrophosphoryl-undecaprenol N-acetylglucosamine transferase